LKKKKSQCFYEIKSKRFTYFLNRSGDEGVYPDLERTCEEKIRNLNPNRYI